jgi:hypothetical protein
LGLVDGNYGLCEVRKFSAKLNKMNKVGSLKGKIGGFDCDEGIHLEDLSALTK